MAYVLSALDVMHVSVVLEDCIDQLAILGRILPASHDPKQHGTDEIAELVEKQKLLESKYEELVSSPNSSKNEEDVASVTKAIHINTQAINKSFRRNKFVQDAGQKVHQDQNFLLEVLRATLDEMNTTQSFTNLVNAVNSEKAKNTELQAIVAREEASRKRVKQLQRAILDNRKEQETELQNRNELIAHLKDQLQETKAKTSMESKYIKKDAEVKVACSQRRCQQTEQQLRDEIAELNEQMSNEARCNSEIENFLRRHHTLLEEKVEYWMDKYDNEVDKKQSELDSLKASKASDLANLQELTQKYHDYTKVVQEDRQEKEILRREAERELEEQKACVKVQAWWRGIMVRKQLGPYKPKKKGKKGKKGGKGKKGKKK